MPLDPVTLSLIASGVSLGIQGLQQRSAAKRADAQELEARQNDERAVAANKFQSDSLFLKSYPTAGIEQTTFAKYGGWVSRIKKMGKGGPTPPKRSDGVSGGYYNQATYNPDEQLFKAQYSLPVVDVVGQDDRVKAAVKKGRAKFLSDSLDLMGEPQRRMMQGLTGKKQTPSEAWGFNQQGLPWYHPKNVADFAMDAVLDLTNIAGVGLVDDVLKLGVRKGAVKTIAPKGWELPPALNPANRKSKSGLDWLKKNYASPEFLKRYESINTAGIEAAGIEKSFDVAPYAAHAVQKSLEEYVPKNYLNLLKDKGLGAYKRYGTTTRGVSYGNPEGIYVNRGAYAPFNKKGLESVRVHELTHLIEGNGGGLSDYEDVLLRKPFGVVDNADVEKFANNYGKKKTNVEYYLKPTEIHARMNQARFDLGLNLEDEFTEAMFDKIAEKNKWYGMGSLIKDKKAFIENMNKFWAAPPAAGVAASQDKGEFSFGGTTPPDYIAANLPRFREGGPTSKKEETPQWVLDNLKKLPQASSVPNNISYAPSKAVLAVKGALGAASFIAPLRPFINPIQVGADLYTAGRHAMSGNKEQTKEDLFQAALQTTTFPGMKKDVSSVPRIFEAIIDTKDAYEGYKALKAMGGLVNPDYIAEGEEVVDFGPGNVPQAGKFGTLSRLSSNTAKINGDSHDDPSGGVEMTGGDRVFSDRLPLPSGFISKLRKL